LFFISAGNVSRKLISYYKYLNLTATALYVFECLLLVVIRKIWKNSGITGKKMYETLLSC